MMVCTTKQAPKPSRISTEINAHVLHAFPVQLRAKGTKIFTLFVFFWFKNRAQVKLRQYMLYKLLEGIISE